MQKLSYVLVASLTLFSLSGAAIGQQGQSNASKESTSVVSQFFMLRSTDGRNHEIETIAVDRSDDAEVIYIVERVQDLWPKGSTGPIDGEYLLWKLDMEGKVLHKTLICKKGNNQLSRATILFLPSPQEGAILVGMFGDQYRWSLHHVDAAGKILKSVNKRGSFTATVLLPDAKGLLMVGSRDFKGSVWKVDFDGETVWEKSYTYQAEADDQKEKVDGQKADAREKSFEHFYRIAFTDDQGGFVVAGDHGIINTFGMGSRSIWLMRCDEAGTVLTETTFPGRYPSLCSIGNDQFAVLYDVASGFASDGRVCVVDLELKQQWEKKTSFSAMIIDKPAISSIPSEHGFVLAGCNVIINREKRSRQKECRFFQYDATGRIVASATIPITEEAFLHTHIVCGINSAYVACQTKGMTPLDVREAGVFKISLNK